jgi:hypothetical protein
MKDNMFSGRKSGLYTIRYTIAVLLFGSLLAAWGCKTPVDEEGENTPTPRPARYAIVLNQPGTGGAFTVTVGDGTPASSNTAATAGTTVTLAAFPAENFHFQEWLVTGAELTNTGSTGSFSMPAGAVVVTAVFEPTGPEGPSAITVIQPETGGSFTVAVGSSQAVNSDTEAEEGTTITLTSIAKGNYRFKRWIVTGADLDNDTARPAVFTMPDAGVTVTAEFENRPPASANPYERLGVYVYDRNPTGVDYFSQWVGHSDVKYAEDFLGYDYWQSYTGEWWNDYRPQHWQAWKAANPTGRRLVLAVSPFPKNGLSGGNDYDKAGSPEARQKYQAAAAGEYNEYYRQLGEQLKALGLGDTIIRFGHEMTGGWYVYSISVGASDEIRQEKQVNYGKAFNEFAKTLLAIPDTNFEFCWNPNTDSDPAHLIRCYPGDEYVDYIAFDQYDHSLNTYSSNAAYHTSTDQNYRRGIQQQAWNQMMRTGWGTPTWFATFAQQHDKPLVIAEWGLWLQDNEDGGDNPYFIEKMYEWINANNVAWHVYFMFGDVSHSLYDTVKYPLASQRFQELWNPNQSPQVTPAIPPSHTDLAAYDSSKVKLGTAAAFGRGIEPVSDPWAYSGGMLAGMWTHDDTVKNDTLENFTSITFEDCPASSGFALVYQLWHSNLSNSESDNNQRVSLYVNGELKESSRTLVHGGRGWGDSYKIAYFDVTIPEGASVMFRADRYNWAWTRLNFDYIIFK